MSHDSSRYGGPPQNGGNAGNAGSGGRGDPGARAPQDGPYSSSVRPPAGQTADFSRPAASGQAEPRSTAPGVTSAFGGDTELLTESKEEYDHVGRELDEIRMLVKQSASELEKLTQRKVLAAARVREMEEKIETFSRQELRRAYQESSEAEMRAFMMGEQREKLQEKEKVLDRYQQYLRRAIEALASATLDRGAAPARWNEPSQRAKPGTGGPRENKLAALARVIQAQEDVRQRVAQRLHDGPAQSLANVVLTAEICEKLVQTDPQRAQGELGNLKGLVNSTLQDTRKFIFELRPMTLDDLGLVPTLRRYVTDVGAKFQVQVNLVAPQGDQRLPRTMEVPIFRVAQEALSNAIQHGRATQVRVTLTQKPEGVVLVVEDNGAGFDVEQALARAAAHETVGIASMQERAEMLGGWLRIESARGHGTRVELSATG